MVGVPEPAGETVTLAEACLLLSATLVAVTVTDMVVLVVGALKFPELEMLPPVADQVTALLLVPLTEALNDCDAPDVTVAEAGETETEIVSGRTAIPNDLSPCTPF